jgi:hypothetical protein
MKETAYFNLGNGTEVKSKELLPQKGQNKGLSYPTLVSEPELSNPAKTKTRTGATQSDTQHITL